MKKKALVTVPMALIFVNVNVPFFAIEKFQSPFDIPPLSNATKRGGTYAIILEKKVISCLIFPHR
jgi:hypothetical protein